MRSPYSSDPSGYEALEQAQTDGERPDLSGLVITPGDEGPVGRPLAASPVDFPTMAQEGTKFVGGRLTLGEQRMREPKFADRFGEW